MKEKHATQRGHLARPQEWVVWPEVVRVKAKAQRIKKCFAEESAREKNKPKRHEGAWHVLEMAMSSDFPEHAKRRGESTGARSRSHITTDGAWLDPDGEKEPPGRGVTGSALSFRMMSCWPEQGGWMRGDKAEGRRASHASPHHPQLVSPRPAPHQLFSACPGWSCVVCGSCQNSKGMRKLSYTSDFQARDSLVPKVGKATFTDAKTLISPAAQGRGRCINAN